MAPLKIIIDTRTIKKDGSSPVYLRACSHAVPPLDLAPLPLCPLCARQDISIVASLVDERGDAEELRRRKRADANNNREAQRGARRR